MIQLLCGDCLDVLKTLPDCSVQCVVTSPPYFGLRSYGMGIENGEMGCEPTPDEYIAKLVAVFHEFRRVLRDDGTLWVVIGDSYIGGKGQSGSQGPTLQEARHDNGASLNRGYQTLGEHGVTKPTDDRKVLRQYGIKPKDMLGIPWMLAFALRADGWYLRQEIIWAKRNCMPESVKDRCTKSHESVFLLSKSPTYYFDNEAIKEPSKQPEDNRGGRGNRKRFPTDKIAGIRGPGVYPMANKRDVWFIATHPYPEAHFATYPPALVEPCILAGSRPGDTVLDPFNGAGTTGLVAVKNGRNYIGIELNPEYVEMSRRRIEPHLAQPVLDMALL